MNVRNNGATRFFERSKRLLHYVYCRAIYWDSIHVPTWGKPAAIIGGHSFEASRITLIAPKTGTPVVLRTGTSDLPTFCEIFVDGEYHIPFDRDVHYVLDLGANIGLTAVYLAGRFPKARIVCVEPDAENFKVLLANIESLPNVEAIRAAIWSEPGTLQIVREDRQGQALGNWGTQTHPLETTGESRNAETVEAVTIRQLAERFGLPRIDLLKVDIEGAELELFSRNASDWLPMTGAIVVETHNRFRPGSDEAVRQCMQNLDYTLSRQGDNLVYLPASPALQPVAPLARASGHTA